MILRIFEKRRQRGHAFDDAQAGDVFSTPPPSDLALCCAIAGSIADGTYRTQPVDLWCLETNGKRRAAHMPAFTDHVVGSAMYRLLSRKRTVLRVARHLLLPPGLTNATAMRALAAFVRRHRDRVGPTGPPLYVLQSGLRPLRR